MRTIARTLRHWPRTLVGLMLLLFLGLVVDNASAGQPANTSNYLSGGVLASRPQECELAWNVVPNPGPSGLYDNLTELDAISPNNIWAVGAYQDNTPYRTLIEHWDGNAWSVVPSPNPGTGDNYLFDISAASANDVWAVGYYRGPNSDFRSLALHWDGSAWTQVSLPDPDPAPPNVNELLGITAISTNDVWAVGFYTGGTLIMHWNGSAWSQVSSPNRGNNWNRLYSVSASGPNDIWAVGNYRDDGYPEKTLILHWDGSIWSIVSSPNPTSGRNLLYGVTVVSPSDVWAVGNANSDVSIWSTIILHWSGSDWTQVTSPNPGTYNNNVLLDIDAVSANDIWAVGSYDSASGSYTLAVHWDGSVWNVVATQNPGPYPGYYTNFAGVTALVSDNVWAVGDILIEHYSTDCPIPTPTPVTPTATVPPTATPTPCTPGSFSDVPPDNTFYPFVTCLVNRNIISGYGDCTFRPNNLVTRSQIAKIVSNAADFQEDPGVQIFEDVPDSNPFYQWINRLARRGHMVGYPCGGEGEPCGGGESPYFRPFATATRSQLAKIVSNAAGFIDEPTGQMFADVPSSHPFYVWVQRLASRQIMGGYACGGEGEPCDSENRPYFRPYNAVTRGQSSKIVAGAFFPGCQNPLRR